jgi:sigma-E factor negative regulatory protein RseC
MIEERARVVAVRPGFAWVESTRKSACGTCTASSGCGTAVVAKLFGERVNRLQVADNIGVQVGDRVVIGIADGTLTRASLAAYVLPLLALMLAAFLAQSAGADEGGSALFGTLGLGVGLWVTGRLTGGPGGRERYRATLLRRVEPEGIDVSGLPFLG